MAISMTKTAITRGQVIKEPKLPRQRDHKTGKGEETTRELELSMTTRNPTASLLPRGKSQKISWKRRKGRIEFKIR